MKLLDLFSGIGGFHLGLKQAGFEFDWVGFSEIDKYAKATYKKNFPDAVDLGDVRTIRHEDLPKIDIITFGSPCQDFSIAGKRAGLDGDRSSLIGEAIRLIADCKPRFFIWENVKGTFSSNNGEDFWAIIQAFTDIGGYRLEWQLLNTRWFLPQNRERIYLVGCLGGEGRAKIFPIGEIGNEVNELQGQFTNTLTARYEGVGNGSFIIEGKQYAQKGLKQIGTIGKDSEATRVYDTSGCARTIKDGGGMGAKTGLYQVMAYSKSHRTGSSDADKKRKNYGKVEHRIKTDEFNTLSTGKGCSNMSSSNFVGMGAKTGLYQIGDYRSDEGYRKRKDGNSPTLTAGNRANSTGSTPVPLVNKIRRLTPVECERLQGFPDGWTEGQSDTQRYKQLGNAVTVNVVEAVGRKIKEK